MAKTGEQDRDGLSSLQGSEHMICFILRADIIQPDHKISFKRRVNNVTIELKNIQKSISKGFNSLE